MFCSYCLVSKKVKSIGFTDVANFALDYITPCTIINIVFNFAERQDRECYIKDDGTDYRGTVSVSRDGYRCRLWLDIDLDLLHENLAFLMATKLDVTDYNYCRNPDGDTQGVWCYLEPGQGAPRDWDYCDIGDPADQCDYVGKCK